MWDKPKKEGNCASLGKSLKRTVALAKENRFISDT
jgi:hypothetical protein